MIVMKFGGSSVANRSQIEKVREIVAARLPRRSAKLFDLAKEFVHVAGIFTEQA